MTKAKNKLVLNDSSVTLKAESSQALGQGFRVGFLGTLHMEVFVQRLEDEFGANIICTAPSVPYTVETTEGETIVAENQMIEGAPNGTGDLFAALFLSRLIGGASDEVALAAASASTFEVIARSVKAGGRELELVDQQDALVHPMTMVDIRRLASARRPVRPSGLETL